MAKENEVGPTGQFPRGKLFSDDEGELAIGMAIDEEKGVIVLHFGKPTAWIAFEPEEAIVFADAILNKANELNERRS